MAKSGKSIEIVQDRILNQFQRDIRSYENRFKNDTLSAVERAILEGKKNRERTEELQKQAAAKPYISFYNPDNILNRTRHLSPEDRKAAIKAYNNEQKRLAKETK
jgi:hypothetical protein